MVLFLEAIMCFECPILYYMEAYNLLSGGRQLAHIFGHISHLVQYFFMKFHPHHQKNMAIKLIPKSQNLKMVAMVTCVRD